MGLDHVETRCDQHLGKFGHRPSITSRRGMIKRLYRCAFEEAHQQPTTWADHAREFSERCLDILRVMVNERVPGQHAAQ